MTTKTIYNCNGCGKEKRGQPTAEQEHDFRDGEETIPEDWSRLN